MPNDGKVIEKVIEHLSQDIVSQTETMMTFRTRVAFTMWIGPFLVLGGYLIAAKGSLAGFHGTRWTYLFLATAAICFLGIAAVLAKIEQSSWRQCNRWREIIVGLQSEEESSKVKLQTADLNFRDDVMRGYLLLGFLILLLFSSILFVAVQSFPTGQETPQDPKPVPAVESPIRPTSPASTATPSAPPGASDRTGLDTARPKDSTPSPAAPKGASGNQPKKDVP